MSNINNILNLNEEILSSLKPNEKEAVIKILEQYKSNGESNLYLDMLEEDYEERPVDIETFITDSHFIGNITDNGNNIYPYWRRKLSEIFSPDNNFQEIIFTGAIGLGKTTIAVIGMSYVLYKLLCLKNPQAYYGLQSNSKIVIAFINITLDLSYGVAFKKMQSMLLESPWFLEHGTVTGRDEKNKQYHPDKGIIFSVGSSDKHMLGQDIFCLKGDTKIVTSDGVMRIDEINKPAFVYSVDDEGDIILSNMCFVEHTKNTNEIIKISLDNGGIIECTPEHRLMLKSGQYKMAKDLTYDDELMEVNY